MQMVIGVMGASVIPSNAVREHAFRLGELIAASGAVLVTGATTGLPLAAAEGATIRNGEVIGFSPAINIAEHERLGLPITHHDLIICTGLTPKGRNLLNVRACNGLIFIGGSMGALNEFTIAYDEEKIIGILEGSGGFCNHLQQWMNFLAKPGNRSILHYDLDPDALLKAVLQSIQNRTSDHP